MLISSAYAQAAGGAGGDAGLLGFLPIILMFVLLWFLMIRPQMKRQKEHKSMVDTLQKGDEVVTAGGVVGRITKVADSYVTLEIATGTEIVVQRSAVQLPLPKGTIKSLQ
ncbi:MAG: preprotein translocase subunit YajC [Proteobacteria bacterium]|nr:preprotein translocase subunit YajC [Pseudomonadota bacterium]MDA0982679.1 preprotein translocase subunit YajC [Pseudomonadota bacterium]